MPKDTNPSDNSSVGKRSSSNSLDRSAKPNVAPIITAPQNVTPPNMPPNTSNSSVKSKFHTVTISNLNNKQDGQRKKIKEYEQKMSEYQSQITDYELKNLELEAKVYVSF